MENNSTEVHLAMNSDDVHEHELEQVVENMRLAAEKHDEHVKQLIKDYIRGNLTVQVVKEWDSSTVKVELMLEGDQISMDYLYI